MLLQMTFYILQSAVRLKFIFFIKLSCYQFDLSSSTASGDQFAKALKIVQLVAQSQERFFDVYAVCSSQIGPKDYVVAIARLALFYIKGLFIWDRSFWCFNLFFHRMSPLQYLQAGFQILLNAFFCLASLQLQLLLNGLLASSQERFDCGPEFWE